MSLPLNRVICGNCLEIMREWPSESIDFCMFSPPYWGLRCYGEEANIEWPDGWKGQLGLEPSWKMYIEHMRMICREIKRILKKTGNMYIVIGDTYYGGKGRSAHAWSLEKSAERLMKGETLQRAYTMPAGRGKYRPQDRPQTPYRPKCLMGIPWRLAFALIEDGWILRNDVIWHKPNAMPSSAKDRLTQTYEHIFHFVKSRKYYYNLDAIREPHTGLKDLGRKRLDTKTPKHDLAVKMGAGNISPSGYLGQHPKGKNPGDTIKWNESTKEMSWYFNLGRIRAEMRMSGLPERNPKGRNPGDFWSISTKPFKGAHFAVYPLTICVRPILSSCPPNGIVFDPMCGTGTTLAAAKMINLQMWDRLGYMANETARKIDWNLRFIGIDINPAYVEMAKRRLSSIPEKLTRFLQS